MSINRIGKTQVAIDAIRAVYEDNTVPLQAQYYNLLMVRAMVDELIENVKEEIEDEQV